MFLISKCIGELDLGLCTTSGLAKIMPLGNGILRPDTFLIGSRHCTAALFLQVPAKLCSDLDLILLYILKSGEHSKFARQNENMPSIRCMLKV